jgi:heat shock protein HslJ
VTDPGDPSAYTLRFEPDGTLELRVDCNRAGGSYRLEQSRLVLEITHSTMAACAPESLDRAFLKDLNEVVSYSVREGHLYLVLKNDSGTMELRRLATQPEVP